MYVLVANLGSTSFKYRLYDMRSELQLARGSVERIGSEKSRCSVEIGDWKESLERPIPHHGKAVQVCLEQLTDAEHGVLQDPSEVAAIGFKAVHGGNLQGVFRIDEKVLEEMNQVRAVAPAHNPPYIAAMKQLSESIPSIPLVAAFETDFHSTIPECNRRYGIPKQWADALPIRRWGFHGASHRFISERMQVLAPQAKRVVSCHLGGSSSLCAILDGASQASTMGMSPQSGLSQNNRVGDFDPFCLPMILERFGLSLDQALHQLANEAGLLGLSGGLSGDLRDLEEGAGSGNPSARLALDVFAAEVRRHLGSMAFLLGGIDALVFTGGIGENSASLRAAICDPLMRFGIALSSECNGCSEPRERRISEPSGIEIWVVPTNEEIIVARQTAAVVEGGHMP